MKRFISIIIFQFFLLSAVDAQVKSTRYQALDVITNFADAVCTSPPLVGKDNSIELTGEGKAQLTGLLKKLTDVGISGSAKYKNNEYEGVLQKDLAGVISKANDCRLEVWRDLKDRLLPEEPKKFSSTDRANMQIIIDICSGNDIYSESKPKSIGDINDISTTRYQVYIDCIVKLQRQMLPNN